MFQEMAHVLGHSYYSTSAQCCYTGQVKLTNDDFNEIDKMVRSIISYTDYINRTVWKK